MVSQFYLRTKTNPKAEKKNLKKKSNFSYYIISMPTEFFAKSEEKRGSFWWK